MSSAFSIDRSVFAVAVAIVILLGGGIAFIALLPAIPPPTVEVSADYPGAEAEVVRETVAAPIEQQINGVEGMVSMSSNCTDDGHYRLIVTFQPGTDLDIAWVLVELRETLAEPALPEAVRRRGIEVVKKESPAVGPPLLSSVRARRAARALLILYGILSLGLLWLVAYLVRKARRPVFAVDGLAGPASGKAIAAAFHPDESIGHSSTPDGLRAVPARRADDDALKE